MAIYHYEGIGKAGALMLFGALAASPLSWLATGFLGRITFSILEMICTWLAGKGVILLNIAVADIQTISQKRDFDGSFRDAFTEIAGNPHRLSAEDRKRIDEKVKAAFRKFATFGVRDGGDSEASPWDNPSGLG